MMDDPAISIVTTQSQVSQLLYAQTVENPLLEPAIVEQTEEDNQFFKEENKSSSSDSSQDEPPVVLAPI